MLALDVKLQLYESAVVSVLIYGCEGWWLTPELLQSLNGWNSRCLARITGRSFRDEAVSPSYGPCNHRPLRLPIRHVHYLPTSINTARLKFANELGKKWKLNKKWKVLPAEEAQNLNNEPLRAYAREVWTVLPQTFKDTVTAWFNQHGGVLLVEPLLNPTSELMNSLQQDEPFDVHVTPLELLLVDAIEEVKKIYKKEEKKKRKEYGENQLFSQRSRRC